MQQKNQKSLSLRDVPFSIYRRNDMIPRIFPFNPVEVAGIVEMSLPHVLLIIKAEKLDQRE